MNDSETKIVHKGMSTAQNQLHFEHFKKVLDKSSQMAAYNLDIRYWKCKLMSYKQDKVGLTSIYIK